MCTAGLSLTFELCFKLPSQKYLKKLHPHKYCRTDSGRGAAFYPFSEPWLSVKLFPSWRNCTGAGMHRNLSSQLLKMCAVHLPWTYKNVHPSKKSGTRACAATFPLLITFQIFPFFHCPDCNILEGHKEKWKRITNLAYLTRSISNFLPFFIVESCSSGNASTLIWPGMKCYTGCDSLLYYTYRKPDQFF